MAVDIDKSDVKTMLRYSDGQTHRTSLREGVVKVLQGGIDSGRINTLQLGQDVFIRGSSDSDAIEYSLDGKATWQSLTEVDTSFKLNPKSPYQAESGDYIVFTKSTSNSSEAARINLPKLPVEGCHINISSNMQLSSSCYITVRTLDTSTIEDGESKEMRIDVPRGYLRLVYVDSNWIVSEYGSSLTAGGGGSGSSAGGTVSSVNGVGPDAAGNVELLPSSLGAAADLPDDAPLLTQYARVRTSTGKTWQAVSGGGSAGIEDIQVTDGRPYIRKAGKGSAIASWAALDDVGGTSVATDGVYGRTINSAGDGVWTKIDTDGKVKSVQGNTPDTTGNAVVYNVPVVTTTITAPTASDVGKFLLYIGDSGTYTPGSVYKCVEDSGSYSWKSISTSGAGGTIGEIFAYPADKPPEGCMFLMGQLLKNADTSYKAFFEWVYNNSPAGFTIVDSHDIQFPTVKDFIQGIDPSTITYDSSSTRYKSSKLGVIESAGLPNITGNVGYVLEDHCSGAFTSVKTASIAPYGATYRADIATLNASLASTVYGASTTVQPPSIHYYWCIRVFSSTTNMPSDAGSRLSTAETNITSIQTMIGPVTASGSDYVTETWRSTTDTTKWYRKYKSGWVEQGGITATVSASPTLIEFNYPFADATNYTVLSIIDNGSNTTVAGTYTGVCKKTATNCYVAANSYGGVQKYPIRWYACGMGSTSVTA